MTKAHSSLGDNDGRCESCNRPETAHQPQTTYPIRLGGGLGWGTLWLCPDCLDKHRARDRGTVPGR
jgi:hypothetical protein